MAQARERETNVSTGVAADSAKYPDRLAEPQSRMLMDTGVRLAPQRCLALCSREGKKYIALVCGRCQRVTVKLHTWGGVANPGRCY